jgi:hypothetical protein
MAIFSYFFPLLARMNEAVHLALHANDKHAKPKWRHFLLQERLLLSKQC